MRREAAARVLADAARDRCGAPRHPRRGEALTGSAPPQGADYPPHRSPLTFPPCDCGAPVCPDRRTPPDPDEPRPARPVPRPDSPLLLGLRSRIREENQFRAWFRELG